MRHENIQLSAVFLCPSTMSSQTSHHLSLTTGLQASPQESGAETEDGGSAESYEPGLLNKVKAGLHFIPLLGVSILARRRSAIP